MMSVIEYAQDMNKEVSIVLKKCKELGIDANLEDDLLDDEGITLLDNYFQNEVFEEEEFDEEEFIENETVEVVVSNQKINHDNVKKVQKLKKKQDVKVNKKKEFANKKKEMYKNKEKLVSNKAVVSDNVILYKEGMTVSEFANVCGLGVGEVIKKLMSLGMMMNLNQVIDFDTASVIAMDINKELKREEVMDEANFEELEINESEDE